MVLGLALAATALRAGMVLRRRRLGGVKRGADLLYAHLRLARPAVVWLLVGFVGGPLSMKLFRQRAPLETLHALLGILAAAAFLATGVLGWQLSRGKSRAVDLHGKLGLAAMLAAAGAAVAGFVLLP